MIHCIHECEPWLIIRVQKAIVVLVQGRPIEAPSIGSEYEIILDLLEGEVQAMFISKLPQVPIE